MGKLLAPPLRLSGDVGVMSAWGARAAYHGHMKTILSLLLLFGAFAFTPGCMTEDACSGDHCVCTGSDGCDHTCASGAPECHIQGNSGPVDVTCQNNGQCHVECSGASSCAVDCGNSGDCHVTCPASGCTVTKCVGSACAVTCGLTGIATRNGTTATCP